MRPAHLAIHGIKIAPAAISSGVTILPELPEQPAVALKAAARRMHRRHKGPSPGARELLMRRLLIMLAFVVFLLFFTMIAATPVAG